MFYEQINDDDDDYDCLRSSVKIRPSRKRPYLYRRMEMSAMHNVCLFVVHRAIYQTSENKRLIGRVQ